MGLGSKHGVQHNVPLALQTVRNASLVRSRWALGSRPVLVQGSRLVLVLGSRQALVQGSKLVLVQGSTQVVVQGSMARELGSKQPSF
jgi:hypothetical protein